MCVAVKADAYGHGAVPCAKAVLEAGAQYLAVATVDEGIELRENGIDAPVLLLSLCSMSEIASAVKYDITPLVFDRYYVEDFAREVKKSGRTDFAVHIAVDTGMGRIGVYPEEAGELALQIHKTGCLKVDGICTHFAVSDGASSEDDKYTKLQYERFMQAVDSVKQKGIDPGIRHCCASAACLTRKDMQLDMVRPGIIAYGYYADEIDRDYLCKAGTPLDLKEVMTLECEVSAVRKFKKGMSVGYGRTWTAPEDTEIAVLTIGYGDGLLRAYGKAGLTVAINGRPYPVRGRICMDQCMVELGNGSGVQRGDKAVIFGLKEDGALQNADDIARKAGTISYEVATCITKRVPRVFIS